MTKAPLKDADTYALCREFGVVPMVLNAVRQVESAGRGFLPDGRPKILLEAHILWKRLGSRQIDPQELHEWDSTLCSPKWNREFYKGGKAEYVRVDRVILFATQADAARTASYRKAAWESCSWGLMQLMGFNYKNAGFENVDQLVTEMKIGEKEQMAAALRWMQSTGVLEILKAVPPGGAERPEVWRDFARAYNGPGQVTLYADKLAAAASAARLASA